MTVIVLMGYAIGAILGWRAMRSTRVAGSWPHAVRAQLLITEVALSIAAVWSIDSADSIVWPLLMVLALVLITLYARLTVTGPRASAHAALQAWSAGPNTGFFIIPVATMLVGPEGAVAAVLMHRMGAPLFAWWTHALRRQAPNPQRWHTSLIDQSPLIALAIGLLLRLTGPAPEWIIWVSLIAAPVLAASGAAIFVGSVLHHSQRIDPRPGVRRWLGLTAARIVLLGVLALLAPNLSLAIVAILAALTIPSFGPSQMSTVYGYADPVVAAGARWGWFVGAAGAATALAVARAALG